MKKYQIAVLDDYQSVALESADWLPSNRKSAAAIHLYEKRGFVHDPEVLRTFGARYRRADVAMRYYIAGANLTVDGGTIA